MNYTLLLMGIILPIASYSQQDEKTRILQWQNQHPSTVIISSVRYNSLDKTQKYLLGEDLVIFENELTLNTLNDYQSPVSQKVNQDNEEIAEAEYGAGDYYFIKDWLSKHRGLNFYYKSEYDSLSESEKLEITQPGYFIISGEEITKQDIINYESH